MLDLRECFLGVFCETGGLDGAFARGGEERAVAEWLEGGFGCFSGRVLVVPVVDYVLRPERVGALTMGRGWNTREFGGRGEGRGG